MSNSEPLVAQISTRVDPHKQGIVYYVATKQGDFPVEFINGESYISPPGYGQRIKVIQPSSTANNVTTTNYPLAYETYISSLQPSPSQQHTVDFAMFSKLLADFNMFKTATQITIDMQTKEIAALRFRQAQLEHAQNDVLGMIRTLYNTSQPFNSLSAITEASQFSPSFQLKTQVPPLPLQNQQEFTDPMPSPTQSMNGNSSLSLPFTQLQQASQPLVDQAVKPSSIVEDTTMVAASKLLYNQGPVNNQFERPNLTDMSTITTPNPMPTSASNPSVVKPPQSTPPIQDEFGIELTQNMTREDVEKWLVERGFPLDQGGLKNATTSDGMKAIHFACHYGNVVVVDFLLNNGFATIHDRTTLQEFTPLLRACRSGQLQIVKYLLTRGSKVDEKDSYGDTALLSAAMYGHLPIVQYLLQNGSSLKERSTGMHSAIVRAAMNGKISVVKWLLANGSSAQEADKDGYTPLLCAALHGYVDLVKYLLSPPAHSSITETSRNGNTAFLCAARDGHLEVIKFLVTLDPNLLNHVDRRGTTVLMRAAANGHSPLVEWILENYPDAVDDKDYEEDSPLSFASMAGHARVVHYLLHPPKGTRGTNINVRNKLQYTPLIRSAMNGKKEVADLLLKEGADLTLVDKDGFSASLCAALHGYLPVLELLVVEAKKRYGTDAIPKLRNMKTNAGRSLMICAGRNGHVKIMEYLLTNELGTVEDKDLEEDTALICAAMNDHVDAVQWLIEHGASAIQPNKDGHTALIRAAMNGRLRTVRWLLDDGLKYMKKDKLNITDTDRDGYTATICAALHGHLDLLKYLVNIKKASLNERTKSGQTALLCAARNGKLEVVKWLLDNGAELGVKDLSENTVLDCARRSNNLPLISYLDKILAPPGASSSIANKLTVTPHVI
jgi:ankyrin repeat protein